MKSSLFLRSLLLAAIGSLSVHAQSSGYEFTTLAGQALLGSADGPGSTAQFASPSDVAVGRDGTLFVADSRNHTIRRITPAGEVSTLAGLAGASGSDDGMGSAARFKFPHGVAVDQAGNVFVADTGNNTIRKITSAGVVSTLAGLAGTSGSDDGLGSAARFNVPTSVAVDGAGNVFVADSTNGTVREITPGGIVTTYAGLAHSFGANDGTGSAARFFQPFGLAVDAAGTLYVSDPSSGTIRKITPAAVVTTFAGQNGSAGSDDGIGAAARFRSPGGLAVDRNGNVYVADNLNSTIRKITPAAVVTTLAGLASQPGEADGTGSAARFNAPAGVSTDDAGNVYVADMENCTIRKITPAGVVTTRAGRPGSEGSADGAGPAARFSFPIGVAVDLAGNLFVADSGNHTIRKISRMGVVTTFAGAAGKSGSADGTGSAARFNFPSGLAVDLSGNVYVADADNFTIRKITPAGIVSTFAGRAGEPGSEDGIGIAARFNEPAGLAVDDAGNVYVADSLSHTIRKITPAGVVSTIAGRGGSSGVADGTGGEARFSLPLGVAVDRDGTLFVTDHRSTIRRISPSGVVTTLAGKAGNQGHVDGVGTDARFFLAGGIALDRLGLIYVADDHNTIRRITSAGEVTTLAGRPDAFGGVDGTGDAARFNFPSGIAVDIAGNLYVTDSGNNTIRRGVSTTRLVNLSVRCRIGTGDQTPVMGFVVSDGGRKELLVRGIGPTLATLGVTGAAIDPQLRLFDLNANPIRENDDWGGSAELRDVFGLVSAFPLEAGSKDAALFTTLIPGLYSAHVTTVGAAGGVALMEAYDADSSAPARLVNLSARTYAGVADDTLIAGFVLAGTAPKTLLLRVAGPSLARLGLGASGLLLDPRLTLFQGPTRIAENDNWGGESDVKAVARAVGAFDFDSDTSKDAALMAALPPGAYTVHVTGANAGTGVALVEIYEVL